jgi:hypothetical protein
LRVRVARWASRPPAMSRQGPPRERRANLFNCARRPRPTQLQPRCPPVTGLERLRRMPCYAPGSGLRRNCGRALRTAVLVSKAGRLRSVYMRKPVCFAQSGRFQHVPRLHVQLGLGQPGGGERADPSEQRVARQGNCTHHNHRRPRELVFMLWRALVGKEYVEMPVHRTGSRRIRLGWHTPGPAALARSRAGVRISCSPGCRGHDG